MASKRQRWAWQLLALLMAFALVLTACSSDDDAGDDGTTTTAGETTDGTTDDGGGDDGGDDGGDGGDADKPVLTAALSDTPNLIELHTFRSTSAYAVTQAAYEPLIKQVFEEQPDGSYVGSFTDHVGAGAESYTIEETDAGGLLGTFTIRQGQTFNDGTPVTANDYKYVFDRSIEGPGYIGLLLPFIGISSTDQIRVLDDFTFQVETTVQSPLFERFMTFQVFGAINQTEADANATAEDEWAFDYYNTRSGGSAPYVVTTFDPDNQTVLDPNPGYWDAGNLPNSGVIITTVPGGEQRARLVSSGEIDIATGIPPRLLAELQDDDNVRIYANPTTGVNYLGMNQNIAPLDNVDVRRAIMLAVPYQAMIDNVMFGFASPAGGVVTSQMETWDSSIGSQYAQDLDAARAALEASGETDVSLLLGVRESRIEDQEAAVLIQDALRQIGITVDVQILPDGDYAERQNNDELPLFIHDWFSWGEDPFYQMTFLTKCGQFTNYSRFCDETYDALVDEGTFTLDAQRRAEVSSQAQQIFFDQAVWAPLWSSDRTIVTGKCVTGLVQDYTLVPDFHKATKTDSC